MRKRKWPELTTTDGARYRERSYWDERYSAGGEAVEEGEQREWFGAYTALKEALPEDLDRSGAILELGCGSSRLSSDLLADGFACVTAADFSPACLAAASAAAAAAARRPPAAPRPLWLALDARRLPLRAALFDAVVEKGMLDALLAGERDPWRVSKAARRQVGLVLDESTVRASPGRPAELEPRTSAASVALTAGPPHHRPKIEQRRFRKRLDRGSRNLLVLIPLLLLLFFPECYPEAARFHAEATGGGGLRNHARPRRMGANE
ncbi:EEF1A lysine methyltransferase 4 isoform X3 [Petromyzon marinus]|uniref:EEF1A lysine methyltransferase 4 isoform X3 n=1 Tax=Petromyzon marinus TaxID=7757 RepID=UPI003F70AC60